MEGAGDSAEASAALQKCVRENCQHFACPYSQNRKLARMYERPVDLEFKRDDGAYYLREPQQRAYEFVLKQVQDSKDIVTETKTSQVKYSHPQSITPHCPPRLDLREPLLGDTMKLDSWDPGIRRHS